jgi:hypothetical protein
LRFLRQNNPLKELAFALMEAGRLGAYFFVLCVIDIAIFSGSPVDDASPSLTFAQKAFARTDVDLRLSLLVPWRQKLIELFNGQRHRLMITAILHSDVVPCFTEPVIALR